MGRRKQPMKKCALEGCEEMIPSCKYCSYEHMQAANYLKMKKKGYWRRRYQKIQREWAKSDSGKRAGVPIRVWIKMPDDWK